MSGRIYGKICCKLTRDTSKSGQMVDSIFMKEWDLKSASLFEDIINSSEICISKAPKLIGMVHAWGIHGQYVG